MKRPWTAAAGLAAIAASAGCSAEAVPAAPGTPPPIAIAAGPDLSGVWSGDATVVSCTGSRYCSISCLGRSFAFVLHLAQHGQDVEGALGAVDVHGATDGRGALALTGQTVLATAGDAQSVQAVTEFTGEASGISLRGRFTVETRCSARAAEAVANDVVTLQYEFGSFTRTGAVGAPAPGGRWHGEAVARACTPPDRFARLLGTVRIRWADGPAEALFELSGVVR